MIACRQKMMAHNIFQWNQDYPKLLEFQKDIKSKELWAYRLATKLIGVVMVSTRKDEEYQDIDWIIPDTKHFYVHRLMVHPNHQKKGYGKKLMQFIEDKAMKNHISSIRLDTFSQNIENQKFYQNLGYVQLPYDVYFPKQSDDPFHCFERVLIQPKFP
ncbi:MAG: GNAT family N-acetyltransferase [Flavobacteriaceae bacterium]|nr:GNAT family N-acetyltransferase [Flavobacteriaceae bacterium]